MLSEIFIFNFSTLTEFLFDFDQKMMPILFIYSSTFGKMGISIYGPPPPTISYTTAVYMTSAILFDIEICKLCGVPHTQLFVTTSLVSHLRWDVMEEYLTSTPDATSWSVGVARLFVSARQRDRQTFGSCIKAMRAEQLIPLSSE